jgi:hypothetical protein
MDVMSFAARVAAYCYATRGSVTSWLRTADRNLAVGGVANSLHRVGLAMDVVHDGPVDVVFADRMADALGLVVIREADHDHLQPKG